MKFKRTCITLFVLVILFPPLQMYSKWHLKTFSGGVFYLLFNVTHLPHDYKVHSWTGLVGVDEPVSLDLRHRYKGKYDIYVMGEVVENTDLNYTVDLSCKSGERLSFDSKDITSTDLVRKKYNNIRLGTYLVENLDGFQDCTIELTAANFDRPIGLRFVKKTHF
ncbi:MAG: hypothetical protein ACQEQ8_07995 [Pseudomonadota bacterium]